MKNQCYMHFCGTVKRTPFKKTLPENSNGHSNSLPENDGNKFQKDTEETQIFKDAVGANQSREAFEVVFKKQHGRLSAKRGQEVRFEQSGCFRI